MYCLLSALLSRPVISLQTGQIAAWVTQPVLEIGNLEVVALSCQSPHHKRPVLLMARDIRQYANDCLIIDNEEELADPGDIVRLGDDLKLNYSPLGKPVVTDSGQKLGAIEDYSINLETNRIQQLHVRQSFLKSLLGPRLIIDRTQITDVTPERITVRDSTVTNPILGSESIPEA